MFSELTDKFLNKQISDKNIEESDRELYQFGYKLLILEIMNISVLIIIGLLFQCLIYMALFAVVYIPLRSYAGGYHASTPIRCAIFSAVLELVIAVSLRTSLYSMFLPHMFIVALAGQTVIWFRAPVEAVHKPIGDRQKRKFRRRARAILLFEAAAIVLCIVNQVPKMGFVIAISHILLSVLMLLPQKE